jgi:pimeloyl-ACP methyl ester carboxylesterase
MMKLLILHGALGATTQLDSLASQLADKYDVTVVGFNGHGEVPISGDHFSIRSFADDVLNYMSANNIQTTAILGYSMGGYVAMYLAHHYPEKISKVITLATKYDWTPEIAEKEVKMLDADKIEAKIPDYARILERRHTSLGWRNVLVKTAEMMQAMGKDNPLKPTDFAHISCKCLVMLGDKDKMVSLTETVNVYNALPDAQLCILPGTAHPIEQVDVELLASVTHKFLEK